MPKPRIQRLCLCTIALVTALILTGCSPESDAERAYARARRQEQLRQGQLRSTLEGATEESAAVDMAKQWPALEGEGNTEQWTMRQMQSSGGNPLFPHWRAQRRGRGRYDVTFTYTLMNELGSVEKKGFLWRVDLVLKLVSEPREMTAAEMGRSVNTRVSRSKSVRRDRMTETNDVLLLER